MAKNSHMNLTASFILSRYGVWITKIGKKMEFHGGFLRAELARAKTSYPMGRIGLKILK